ncbi:MAG: hypothetical protein IPH35_07085 [Rhodoferax sp.]|nr:hypothetical protein [Rhodoferax sp.]
MDMHLLVDISAHGLGHLAQTAPVIAALCAEVPGLELTVRSALPLHQLKKRIGVRFAHIQEARDFGFVMHSAVDVDLKASARAYREFHHDWPQKVAAESHWLNVHRVDAVLSNVAYLPLAGAAKAGIAAASLCSLNWADVFFHYFGPSFANAPWAQEIHAQMLDAYKGAECFLRPTPGLPMRDMERLYEIGPIAHLGRRNRAIVSEKLGIAHDLRWVLLAMGGMEFRLPIESWEPVQGVVWLVPSAWGIVRPDVCSFEHQELAFSDILASVDAVVTKPGYGTFVEAACAGVPILYVERGDWPETTPFATWLAQHARSRELSRERVMGGDFIDDLAQLWQQPPPPGLQPTGAIEAARILQTALGLAR